MDKKKKDEYIINQIGDIYKQNIEKGRLELYKYIANIVLSTMKIYNMPQVTDIQNGKLYLNTNYQVEFSDLCNDVYMRLDEIYISGKDVLIYHVLWFIRDFIANNCSYTKMSRNVYFSDKRPCDVFIHITGKETNNDMNNGEFDNQLLEYSDKNCIENTFLKDTISIVMQSLEPVEQAYINLYILGADDDNKQKKNQYMMKKFKLSMKGLNTIKNNCIKILKHYLQDDYINIYETKKKGI